MEPDAPESMGERRTQQVDNAIRAIREKKPLPEIDFSIHVMEDGKQVSTLERVIKGKTTCNLLMFPPGL
jgi:serine/threonine-protein phosphatase 2B catalytic subunit